MNLFYNKQFFLSSHYLEDHDFSTALDVRMPDLGQLRTIQQFYKQEIDLLKVFQQF